MACRWRTSWIRGGSKRAARSSCAVACLAPDATSTLPEAYEHPGHILGIQLRDDHVSSVEISLVLAAVCWDYSGQKAAKLGE